MAGFLLWRGIMQRLVPEVARQAGSMTCGLPVARQCVS